MYKWENGPKWFEKIYIQYKWTLLVDASHVLSYLKTWSGRQISSVKCNTQKLNQDKNGLGCCIIWGKDFFPAI